MQLEEWQKEVIGWLKNGESVSFGLNGRNAEVMAFMQVLQDMGLISVEDMGLAQETRLEATWTGKSFDVLDAV